MVPLSEFSTPTLMLFAVFDAAAGAVVGAPAAAVDAGALVGAAGVGVLHAASRPPTLATAVAPSARRRKRRRDGLPNATGWIM